MLPRSKRLSREGFDRLTRARRVTSEHFSISYTDPSKIGGFGIVVSKKIAPLSIVRHHIKRQIRAILSQYDHNGRAIVVFARKGATELPFKVIENELSIALQSILTTKPLAASNPSL